MDAKQLGQKGEAAAAKFYLRQGCKLLAHGYRTRQGELDLVLLQGDTVIVAEVKTRSPGAQVPALQAVTPRKQRRVILAAQRFLQANGLLEHSIRFDAVEVVFRDGKYFVRCIPNAFSL